MLSGRRVLVTGGCGFIGSALAAKLLKRGCRVTILDNQWRTSPSFRLLQSQPGLEYVEGDVLDRTLLESLVPGHHILVHLAALAGVSVYYERPLQTMLVNLGGTQNLLETAQHCKHLQRFLYVSSSEIFGSPAWKVSEQSDVQLSDVEDRRWSYAISKLAAEKLTQCYHWERRLPAVVVRPFNIYGPGQIGEGAVHHFVRAALQGQPLKITGDGLQIRSWCHIDDLLAAMEAALTRPEAPGRSYNIGNPAATTTILDLARLVIRLCCSSSPLEFVPHPGREIHLRTPNISRAKKDLGFQPQVGLEEGLRRTIRWYQDQLLEAPQSLPS